MAHKYEYLLPEFPRTKHLPIEPNAERDDLIASEEDLLELEKEDLVFVEEKIDGANSAITEMEGYPIIRNRNHILNKSYAAKTPAKLQFAPIWNWYYANANKFLKASKLLGFMPSIFGEWMYAQHSVFYDKLPDLFIAFDIFDPENNKFLDSKFVHNELNECGFKTVPLLHQGKVNRNLLLKLRDGPSLFSSVEPREGIYIKVVRDGYVFKRYKMVRNNFIQGEHWNKRKITKNTTVKE